MTLLRARLAPSRLIGSGQRTDYQHHETSSGGAPFTLPYPGGCSGEMTLTIVIADDSGSMAGLGGNDAVSQRYSEAALAFRHLAGSCTCGQEFGAVVHFDCPTSCDVGPVRLDGRGLRRIGQGLRQPPDALGASDLGPALARAAAMAAGFVSGQVRLVVFSDFLLTDADQTSVYAELAGFPGSVHAVVFTADPPRTLLDEPSVTVTAVNGAGQPGDVARAVLASLAERRIGSAAG